LFVAVSSIKSNQLKQTANTDFFYIEIAKIDQDIYLYIYYLNVKMIMLFEIASIERGKLW